jgi:hypothetical protein
MWCFSRIAIKTTSAEMHTKLPTTISATARALLSGLAARIPNPMRITPTIQNKTAAIYAIHFIVPLRMLSIKRVFSVFEKAFIPE